MSGQQAMGTAVVIGGSMAGLLAARVLSEHFQRLVIVERDRLPAGPAQRKGVPQGQHAHALLGQGKQILEHLFPGLTEQLRRQGAPLGRGRYFSGGGYFARSPQAPASLYLSRPLLESAIRGRVAALPNVELLQERSVTGLVSDAERRRIVGVQLEGSDGATAEVVSAALVVDAGGRGSRMPAWLEELGYPRPELERVEVDMAYASRIYERRPEHLAGDLMLIIAPTTQNPRACALLAQEGDRWQVTLAGYFGDRPPLDEAGFLQFARALPTQDVSELLQSARPLSEPVAFRFPSNQRWRYERLHAFPTGLLVIGDALCSFTPAYGQGMSVAATEALALSACLAQGHHDLARRFFQRAAQAIDNPWALTVGNDKRLSQLPLPRPRRMLNWYLDRYQHAAQTDPVLALAFQRVGNLFAAPASLLHPALAWRVLRSALLPRALPGVSLYHR